MSDRELVEEFLEHRSEKAFRILYKAMTPSLFGIAWRLSSRNKNLAEELIQEMWCIAIRKLPTFEWRSQLKTWLVSILINLSKEHYRLSIKEMVDIDMIKEPVAENSFDPVRMGLERAIAQLPFGYRQIIILHDIEGYKHHEIAEILQIAEGTSKSQLFQARKNLKKFLK